MTKPYCIGSDDWNGLSKLIEELGELQQVCGKLIGSEGSVEHWSGDLRTKFIEEVGDVRAALTFFVDKNFSEDEQEQMFKQSSRKLRNFRIWDREVRDAQEDQG